MSPLIVGVLGFVLLFLLMLLKLPIGPSMLVAGFAGAVYLRGFGIALDLVAPIPFDVATKYDMSVIPLFVLMAAFLFHAQISVDLYAVGRAWLGSLRGGLAMATSVACGLFGAVCGSSVVAAITMGTVSIPEMKRYGYHPKLYTGSIAAGGTVASMIPPSLGFIFYAILTGESIGKLFIAGILPGILQVVLFIIVTYIWCRFNPSLGPPGPSSSLKEKLISLKGIWAAIVLFIVVMGGLYAGFFTPTEAAAVGAGMALLIMLGMRRFTVKRFGDSLLDTGRFASMAFLILMGAMVFNALVVTSRIPYTLASMVSALSLPPLGILIAILIVYFFLGCIMDTLAMTVLTVPVFYPVVMALGYDSVWFGVVFVIMAEMALITPPIGMNVFVISGVAKDVPMQTIFAGIFPYLWAVIVSLILVIAFPQIALVLPSMMK